MALSPSRKVQIAVAIIIIIILLIAIYIASCEPEWGHLDFWKAQLTENPDQIYRRSAGGYDTAAALALRRTEIIPNPTAADHYRAATIIHRNIISQEHRPVVGGDGEATPEAKELSNLRHEMFDRAQHHYRSALAQLTDTTIAREVAEEAVTRYDLPVQTPPEAPAAPAAPAARGGGEGRSKSRGEAPGCTPGG